MFNLGVLKEEIGTKMPDFGVLMTKMPNFGILWNKMRTKMPDFGIFGDKNAQF